MKLTSLLLFSFIVFTFFFPSIAHAHLIGGNGMVSGVFHPLGGVDHLLAMVAVGIIGIQNGGKQIWKLPLMFVLFMIIGGSFPMLGVFFPIVEIMIAVSVFVLGLIIIFSKTISVNWLVLGVSLFAVFHGIAHGSEMPLIINPILYIIGFVCSTIFIHIIGVTIGYFAFKTNFSLKLMNGIGLGISGAGVLFLLNL